MTTFVNGPAVGQTLMLKRAPKFLRVVLNSNEGKFDALDQPEDMPSDDEIIVAYELVGEPMRGFIDGTKCSGVFSMAQYRVVEIQPKDIEMRTRGAWVAWCEQTDNQQQKGQQ